MTNQRSRGDKPDAVAVTPVSPNTSLTSVLNTSIQPAIALPRDAADVGEHVSISADERRFADVLTTQTRGVAIMPPMAVAIEPTQVVVRIREQDLDERLGKALNMAAKACGRKLRINHEDAA